MLIFTQGKCFVFIIVLIPQLLCLDPKEQEIILASSFEGQWHMTGDYHNSQDQISPFNQRDMNTGSAIIYFNSGDRKYDNISNLVIQLLMPEYYDQKMIRIVIQLTQPFDDELQRWENKQKCTYEIYDKTLLAEEGKILIYYIVDKEIIVIESIGTASVVMINYWKTTISPRSSLIFALYAFIVFLAVKRKTNIDSTHIRHQVIPIILSLIIMLVIAMTEIIIGFRSLFGEMSPQAFFTVSGFFNIGVFYQICRFYGPVILKNNIIIFISWGLGIAYLWFILYFRHNYICLILNSLIFLPQIIYHALKGQKIQVDPKFYFILCSNQIYVIYFKACPANIFRQSPNYLLGYCIFGLLFFQIGISLGQAHLGSRFFIPSIFLPNQHNYYNPSQIQNCLKVGNECYICLQDLEPKKKKRRLMVTPCKHVFHCECLQGWMLVKMKCPIDRSDLPPL